ncbi:hypothetical protein CJEDD_08885 [Corynebacterium jeddahense]|uniref:SGNH hydrolase-type esterase domain-containing protein n=2 Tax=Corynebacterium jeddahense TaxID=1414719 RepID=A0ABY7UL16_9CORY|nr:hypothetical protein CJEDD_08885 [Corynebacterium jeddahense]
MDERRYIRLKEWGISQDTTKTPSNEYLRSTDGSLAQEAFRLRTDENGFIKTGNEVPDPGRKRKVILLGDSFVESLFEHERLRFPSLFEDQLQKTGFPFVVLNGGYSGENLLHTYNIFLNKVVPLLKYTEKVIFFTSMIDNRAMTSQSSYWSSHTMHAPILDPRNTSRATQMVPPSTVSQRILFRSLLELCQAFGGKPLVVLSPFRSADLGVDPYLDALFPDSSGHTQYIEHYNLINLAARETAAELKVPTLDASSEFIGATENFYDTLHLNTTGQQKMATLLYDFFRSQY